MFMVYDIVKNKNGITLSGHMLQKMKPLFFVADLNLIKQLSS